MPYETEHEPVNLQTYEAEQSKETKLFLSKARNRFKLAASAENRNRMDAQDDMRFKVGDQWPGETKTQRAEENRPVLTLNRMVAMTAQIVNEQRAQRPMEVVKPVGNGADVDTAAIWSGIIKHIHVNSDSEIAIDNGFEAMVDTGKGYCEIVADYLPGRTFDQELYIRRIKNRFTVYCDPMSQMADETDANWKFKTTDYDYDEYRMNFPNTALASLSDFTAIGDNFPGWGDNKTLRVAEYWHKEWEESTLCETESGAILDQKEYNQAFKDVEKKPKILKKRTYRKCTIQCDVINAIEVIDTYTFPGFTGYIPLVPFIASDYEVDGQRYNFGIIRHAKDAQRSINYSRSAAAEIIALAPKAPFIGYKGQFKDGKWQNANLVNYAYLEADTVTINGQPAPLPQRTQFEPQIQGLLQYNAASDQDFKAVTGIYEPSLGQTKTDQSGRAIDLLQKQGGLTNLNFTDNLSRSLRHIGRIILDSAPFIYDAPRIQRIIKPDGTTNHVVVHAGRGQAADALLDETIREVYDLSVGTYDVVIDVGPSYKTQRMEAFNEQLQLAQADKSGTILKTCVDIIVGNSDAPGAREMAARLKKTIPAGLLDESEDDPQTQIQKLGAQLQQSQALQQELMQHNQQMMQQIQQKTIEAETQKYRADLQSATQITVAGIQKQMATLQLQFDIWNAQHQAAHDVAIETVQQQHEKDLAAQQAQAQQPGLSNNGTQPSEEQ